ncbi:hypothetical protein V1477_016769 [Vespula maculifrons]|uniref:Uncharacterized protein n=1 Tax=Vespula maculifrons TaxID=7453 RepID=A0ABD2B462_VESMC
MLGDRTTSQESIVPCKLFLRATFCFCVKKGNGAYHSSKGASSEEDYASHTGTHRLNVNSMHYPNYQLFDARCVTANDSLYY